MKKVTALAAALCPCLLLSSTAFAQQTEPTRSTTEERPGTDDTTRTADASTMRRSTIDSEAFVKKAGAAGLAEVAAGKLGGQKATNPEVKAFAQRMVRDHSAANNQLVAMAKKHNLEVPTEPDMIHRGMMEKFERQKADADFDHDFMQQMVRDHEASVELFQDASTATDVHPDLRAFAKKTLPTLQDHLQEAQQLESKLAQNQ